jgi:hypothetical protein
MTAPMPPPTAGPADAVAGLSPEQAQIVQIVLGDPAVLAAVIAALTGGVEAQANPALAQAAQAAAQTPPAAGTPNPEAIERALLGG